MSKPISACDSHIQAIPVVLTSSASSVNAQNTFSVPSKVDGNVNKMIQQTTNAQPPRLHPKKRKFDLSELEDDHQPSSTPSFMPTSACNNPVTLAAPPATSSSTLVYQRTAEMNHGGLNGNGNSHHAIPIANFTNYNSTVMTQVVRNTNEAQQVIKKQFANFRLVMKCSQTSSLTYHSPISVFHSSTSNHTKAIAPSSLQQVVTTLQAPVEQADLVDLREWETHNVLAKRKNFYVSGVIVPTSLPSSVLVELKYPEGQQQLYQDIFSAGRFDVISDRVPSLNDVSLN